jgi:hypothetical protein
VNTQTDQVNCGACGTLCQGGEQCVAGKCQLSCQAGLSLCTAAPSDGGVSDASSDVSNDVSVSDAGPVLGSTYCANFQTDNANCGACGVTCGSGQQCVSGACSASCGNGSTLCKPDGGAPYCSVLASDSQNCGSCGNVCGPQQQCVAGTCKTPVLSGTVADVNGVFSNVTFVKCGNGTNTNCTEPVAESSCTAIGRKLVSHASNGTNAVTSLGATNSCQWSISYFTNYDPLVAGQCLVGVSNAQWTTCCNTTQWHGNIVTVPAQTGVQFGFVNSGNTGYNAGLTNTSGTTWGCQTNATAVPVRAGCTNYYVACR